jgi:hypothetical protein
VYYPTPEALADGAEALPECGTRLFIAPEDKDSAPWLEALQKEQFQTGLVQHIGRFKAYEIMPAAACRA